MNDDLRTKLFKTALPHLRMFCAVAHSPFVEPILNFEKEATEALTTYVNPVLDLLGVFAGDINYSELEDGLSIFIDSVEVADTLLEIIDEFSDPESTITLADFGNQVTTIISKITNIANSYSNLHGQGALFMELSAAALGYCANIVATFDGVTPQEKEDLAKAAVELIGKQVETLLTEALGDSNKWTAPFGAVDAGVSVLIAIVEGISEYEQKLDYYNDDGLPEDIAFKEAMLDAVSSGLHDGLSNYAHGIDDVAFSVGKLLGEGCKWLQSHIVGKSYEISVSEMNYTECVREVAKRAQYGTSSAGDTIEIDSANVSLYAQDGDDRIYNVFPNVTILGGHGKDSISLYEGAKYNSILGGNGEDYLYTCDDDSTIEGGKDNDRFLISSNKNELFGSDGADIFFVQGSNNTITGGAGDDLLILEVAKNAVISHTQGEGTDAIFGYDTSDLIKIKGEYSTQISGDDVIIQVGKGGLIVKDAVNLKIDLNTIELEEGETLPTQQGALISNPYDNAVILMPSFQGNRNVLRGPNGNDYRNIKNTTATLKGTTTAGYTLAANEKSITYTKAKTSTLATITGLAKGFSATDDIVVDDETITLPEEALGTSTIKVKGNYTLDIADNLTAPDEQEFWTVKGTTATFKNGTTAYYKPSDDGKSIAYKPATTNGNAVVTVTGLRKGLNVGTDGQISGLDFSGDTVTLSEEVLGTSKVKVSGGYKLALDGELDPATVSAVIFDNNVAALKQTTSAGYTLKDNAIIYSKATTKTLATVSGVKSDDLDLDTENKIITVKADALDERKITIKGNCGYKLALANDAPSVDVTNPTLNLNGTTATVSGNASAGYTLAPDGKSIAYTKENSATLATVTGLKKNSDESTVTLNNKTVTLSADALGTSTVKVKGNYGYKIALDDDVAEPATDEKIWSFKDSTATLQEGTSAGYICDGSTITYSPAKKGATLATITGLAKDFNGTIAVDGNTITLPEDALGTNKISLTGDYTLAIDDSLKTSTAANIWSVSGSTATRKSGTTAYYTLDDKSITYNPAKQSDGESLTLTGLKKNLTVDKSGEIDGITVDDTEKTVTLYSNVLNKTSVTVTDGYSLKLGGDVQESELEEAAWNRSGSKAVLKQTTSAGYSCDGNSIVYNAKDSTETLAIVSGVSNDLSAENYNESTNTVMLKADALKNKVTVSGSCQFDFDDDFDNATIIGSAANDIITVKGDKISVNAGKGNDEISAEGANISISGGKGNDTLWGNANVETTYLYSNGDGNDVIYGFGDNDLLKITGTFSAEVDGDELKFTVGKGSVTLKDFSATSFIVNNIAYEISGGNFTKK